MSKHKCVEIAALLSLLVSEILGYGQNVPAIHLLQGSVLNIQLLLQHEKMAGEYDNTSASRERYNSLITQAARAYAMEPALIKAVIDVESDFNPWCVSRAGAIGLMQLMPGTAYLMNVRNVFEPRENIRGGTKFLKDLLSQYQGDIKLTLAAYNAGPDTVDKYGGIPPFHETKDYVKKVLLRYQFYKDRAEIEALQI